MTELVRYEAARKALAEAVAVDEVMGIVDQAEALRHAARIAGDKTLEINAAQLRFRGERRLGELIIAQKVSVGLAKGGRPTEKTRSDKEQVSDETPAPAAPTLAEAGIDRKLSSRAQKMALLPAETFETRLEQHAEEMRGDRGRVAMDLLKVNAEAEQRAHRRDLARTLSDASVDTSGLRVYPCAYADPPWRLKAGVSSRSYENHYPTMTWPEIIALFRQFRDRLLPDSWFYCWIPRAHLLALVEVETEVEVVATGEIVMAKVMMPLAWAVAKAIGMDAYSTCYVWTKTDEEHPNAQGTGKLVYDQDELLLQFRRGRGLAMPAGDEKHRSNHRERATDHSAKPLYYRQMIADMVGCDAAGEPLPVLEMFARFDKDNPPPRNWDLWGNQASPSPQGDVATATGATHSSSPAPIPPLGEHKEFPLSEIAPNFTLKDCGCRDGECERLDDGSCHSPPAPAIEVSEFEALKALSDFCHPRRAEIIAAVADDYAARGLAILQSVSGEWVLREAGWKRLRELEAVAREVAPERAPAAERHPLDIPEFLRRGKDGQLRLGLVVPAKPDIVDDHVQTRLPVNATELDEAIGLRAIVAGDHPGDIGRHLIGKEWAGWTTEKRWFLTDEGQLALASFVDVPATSAIEATGLAMGGPQ